MAFCRAILFKIHWKHARIDLNRHLLVRLEHKFPLTKRRRRESEDAASFHDNPYSYIAGRIRKDELTMTFALGDNRTYGGFYNAPLKEGVTYNVFTGVESNNGITVSIQCEYKKKHPDLISNLWKTKRITKLISGNDSTIIPLSYDILVMHIR